MDNSARAVDLQSRAEAFLYGHLRGHRDSLPDIIREILKLAVEDEGNPLKDLVRAADNGRSSAAAAPPPSRPPPPPPSISAPPAPPASLEQPMRQRNSKFSLRFSRNKDKERSTVTSDPRPQTAGGATREQQNSTRAQESEMWLTQASTLGILGYGDVEKEKRLLSAAVTPSSSRQQRAKPASSIAYNCVFCGEDYSSKGTCKRHLEDMHVARKQLQCNKCKARFKTVPEVRKHTDPCSSGILGWSDYKPPARHMYSSEFSNQLFRTQQHYTDHLLELCAKPQQLRPGLSLHRKLRNLLEQPVLQDAVESLSLRLFNDRRSWRDVRWDYERVRRAIHDLEYGVPEIELPTYDMSKLNQVHVFLEDLFASREPSTAAVPHPDSDHETTLDEKTRRSPEFEVKKEMPHGHVQPQMSEILAGHHLAAFLNSGGDETESYYPTSSSETPGGGDSTGKRPLSYESSTRVPERMPPGPPVGPAIVYDHNQLANHYIPHVAMPTSASFNPLPMSSTMTAWQFSEQPPPYESMLQGADGMSQQTFGGPMSISQVTPVPPDVAPYASPMQDMVPSDQYRRAFQDAQGAINMYDQMTGAFHSAPNQYHVGGCGQETNTPSWLGLTDDVSVNQVQHPHQYQQPHQHQHQHPPQLQQQHQHLHEQHPHGDGNEASSGATGNIFHGGILDRMC